MRKSKNPAIKPKPVRWRSIVIATVEPLVDDGLVPTDSAATEGDLILRYNRVSGLRHGEVMQCVGRQELSRWLLDELGLTVSYESDYVIHTVEASQEQLASHCAVPAKDASILPEYTRVTRDKTRRSRALVKSTARK